MATYGALEFNRQRALNLCILARARLSSGVDLARYYSREDLLRICELARTDCERAISFLRGENPFAKLEYGGKSDDRVQASE